MAHPGERGPQEPGPHGRPAGGLRDPHGPPREGVLLRGEERRGGRERGWEPVQHRRERRLLHLQRRGVPQHQRHPLLRHVQPGRPPGVLRGALHPRGPVALPALPPVPVPSRRLRPVPEQGRGLQADGGGEVGPRGVRALDPGGPVCQHGLPGADRRDQGNPLGPLEAHLLPVQEEGRGLHPVRQGQLLRGVPRDLRPAGRAAHEDRGALQGGGRDQEAGVLRRAHAAVREEEEDGRGHREGEGGGVGGG